MGLDILLVEDNPLNRQLLRDILQYRGHRVCEAEGVVDAWACLQAGVPQIVLLDVQIPGGGGEELLRRIRERPDLDALPVIAVTASAMQGDRERLLAAGFDGYISKPVDTRALGPAVEAFVAGGRPPRP